ncbi:APC family permease [Rhodococcus sp. Z13]|uniref:APC family permease n=1 Tax=Rhodococcus sacchari TaxID=2962047 RepID=A0ACD4DGK5_9NOCA|nr:APC family permease [Rhodococcus sp. Z13]UYP19137.1 APC family permease [Rhodococcus sp. Z13]
MTAALRAAIDRAQAAEPAADQVFSPLRALGRRQLSQLDLIGQSLSTIAPATGMVFIALWMTVSGPGFGGVVTIAVTTAVVVLVALCITGFTRRLAAAGSLYSFVSQGLGTRAALVTGTALLAGYLGIAISVLAHGALTVLDLAELVGLHLPGAGAWLMAAVVLGGIVALIAVRGVRFATRAILLVETCSLVLIVATMLVAPSGSATGVEPSASSLSLLPFLALMTVLSMAGFESAAFFGPEARRPLVTVSRTVLVTPLVVGALFVFAAVASLSGRGELIVGAYFDGLDSGASWSIVLAVKVGMACSWFASTLGCAQAGSRLLYSMGVERVLPAALARVHGTLRTPCVAVAAFVSANILGACLYLLFLQDESTEFDAVVEVALVTAYTLVAVASLRFLHRIGEDMWWTRGASVFVALLGGGLLAFSAVDGSIHGSLAVPVALVVLGAAGPLWRAVLRRLRPQSLATIGVFDTVETADLLPGAGTLIVDEQGRRRIVAGDAPEERM